jgi:dihydroorotase
MSQAPILIRGGRIVDPVRRRDEQGDLYVVGGRIAPIPESLPETCEEVDARGWIVAPGFWDIHVHLREPGGEAAETIASGSRAAVRGGFTTIVAMPNTSPPIDTPGRVTEVLQLGEAAGGARVLTTACITKGRAGTEVAPLAGLAEAGAVAFTDDGSTVQDDAVMRRAMIEAERLDVPIMDHAQDPHLEAQGVMHEGEASRRYGLPGIPAYAEEKIVRRDMELAFETGCRVHIQHITARGSVRILREGRVRGARVTGELTPHHLALTDEDIDPADANYKMNPPLRTKQDRDALWRGLVAGHIEVLATDHAPHTVEEKARGFAAAPFGIIGLETAVGVTYSDLVQNGRMPVLEWVSRWTQSPARVLGLPPPALESGALADIVIIDPGRAWTIDAAEMVSKSTNTPFHGRTVTGRVIRTLRRGETVWPE